MLVPVSLHGPARRRPLLLDLFCGAGGCAMGYHLAGFEVLGVDDRDQPRYPFDFVQADALDYLRDRAGHYDVVHASPPCQRFSQGTFCRPEAMAHPDWLTPTIAYLAAHHPCWVVESVPRAPLARHALLLCGLMFGLRVFRHRRFESSHLLLGPSHRRHGALRIGQAGMVCVAGHGNAGRGRRGSIPSDHRNKAAWAMGMGIDWMTRDELAQAIPPAYTRYVGERLRVVLDG